MLVGEVRCAISSRRFSWMLSGISQWSAGPTRSSKNRQVRRATIRSVWRSRSTQRDARRAGAAGPSRRRGGGEDPQHDDRQRQRQRVLARPADHDQRHDGGGERRAAHPAQKTSAGRRVAVDRAVGGHPLEQVRARDQHARERADDRVEHHEALMEQEHGRQERLRARW